MNGHLTNCPSCDRRPDECVCAFEQLWDDYQAATKVGVCVECQATNHRDCDPEHCYCATPEHIEQRQEARA